MIKLLLFSSLFLLAGFFLVPAVSFGDLDSPNGQRESGVAPEDIICREDLVLVIRTSGDPVCVTEKSGDKLVERGFGTLGIDSNISNTITPTESNNKKGGSFMSGTGFVSDLTISHPPKIGEEAQLTLQITHMDSREVTDYRGVIDLPEGFELVEGVLDKTEDLKAAGTFEIITTIKAVKTGNWTIHAGGEGGAISSLYVAVSEDDAYLNDGHFPSPPREPTIIKCLTASTSINGSDEEFDRVIQSIPAPDENSEVTSWDAELVMSFDTLKLGQTANYTLTAKASDWPPNPPITKSLRVESCDDHDHFSIIDISVPRILHYDNLLDEHYFTVTGQIKPPAVGEWKLYTEVHNLDNVNNNPSSAYITVTEE